MALNPSGVMSIGGTTVGASINLELNLSATANSSIGQADFRTLAAVPSGQISLSDFYGKSNVIPISILTTRTQYTLSPAVVPGYVAGSTKVQLTIGSLGSQTYLYSTDTSVAALTITGFAAGDSIEIVNNGYIIAKGGNGGMADLTNATAGGPAISTNSNITIVNNLYIAGGGGGGGTPTWNSTSKFTLASGGGGAGGGLGGTVGQSSGNTTKFPGGTGGAPGLMGSNGTINVIGPPNNSSYATGGGGGRVLPGVRSNYHVNGPNGVYAGYGGGAGGGGAVQGPFVNTPFVSSYGGGGGEPGGPSSSQLSYLGGGGGGWGASGANAYFGEFFSGEVTYSNQYGAPGGKAIALNGKTATITGSGIVYGAIS